MERSAVRFAAVAAVITGGLVMGGAGASALADPGTVGPANNDPGAATTGTPATNSASTPGPLNLAGIGLGAPPGVNQPRVGPIPPPIMNLPGVISGLVMPGQRPTTINTPGAAPPPTQAKPAAQVDPVVNPATGSPPTGVDEHASATLPGQAAPIEPPAGQPLIAAPPPVVATAGEPAASPPPQLPLPVTVPASLVSPLAGFDFTPLLSQLGVTDLLSGIGIPSSTVDTVFPGVTVPTVVSPGGEVVPIRVVEGSPPAELAPSGISVPEVTGFDPAPTSLGEPIAPPSAPAPTEPPPVEPATAMSEPVAFRAGYSEYLRNAGIAEITALAAPGAASILLFTAAGGFIGYRQARAGHVVKAEGIGRFLR